MTNIKAVHLCQHTKADGERCRANALNNSAYCFFHAPTKKRERDGAGRAGASNEVDERQFFVQTCRIGHFEALPRSPVFWRS